MATFPPPPPSLSPSDSGLPSIPNTLGAFLIGSFFGILLYGFSLHQAYRYARSFPSDTLFIKMLVIIVMLFETVHAVSTMHSSYYYLVSNIMRPGAFLHGVWSLNLLPVSGGVISLTSQIFFARRVALIGFRERIVAYFAMLLLVAEAVITNVSTIIAFVLDRRVVISSFNTIALALAFCGDLLLSSMMVRAVQQSREGRVRTNESLCDRVLLYTVSTGILTGVFNLFALVLAIVTPEEFIYVAFTTVTWRLCANCLLSVLNARQIKLAGMEIFVDGSEARPVVLANTRLEAAKEIWNVPKLPSNEPEFIKVQVLTETQRKRMSRRRASLSDLGYF